MRHLADVVFAGEPSASRGNVYGDSKKIVLPNSHLTVRVSSLYWQQSDPRDAREFIPVTIPAPLTFGDYAAGRDPALEAAERVGRRRNSGRRGGDKVHAVKAGPGEQP